MARPALHRASWRGFWREVPWLLGVALGWMLLWWLGQAFVLGDPIEGYGWPGYLNNAWMVVHQQDLGYDTFRRPLHGALVGWLGEVLGSYAQGAVLVSSAAMGVLVLSAGLAGRVLGGPWAGALAAAALPTVSHNADAARWANDYPLYAGLGGLSMASALVASRWPHHRGSGGWALLSGVSGGLAIGVDDRGSIAAAVGVGTLVLSGSPRVVAWAPWVLLGLWLGPLSESWLWIPEVPRLSLTEKLEIQRGVTLRWAEGLHDPLVDRACAGEPLGTVPTVAGLLRPCARAILHNNVSEVFPRHFPFGVVLTGVACLAVVVLPDRRRVVAVLWGAGWVGMAMGTLLLQSLWVPQPDRYLLSWALPLSVVVPVGLSRLLQRLGVRGVGLGVGIAVLGSWLWQADPTDRLAPTAVQRNRYVQFRDQVIDAAQSALGPNDQLLDCSELYVSTAVLPRLTTAPPPMLKLLSGDRCRSWVLAPPQPEGGSGAVYVVVDPRLDLRGAGGVRLRLTGEQLRSAGWQPVMVLQDTGLWRRVW